MTELELVRFHQVERLNGRVATWWHYNRMTLAILLTAIAGLLAIVEIERGYRAKAEDDAALIARHALSDPLVCYSHKRSTSLLIAGGSREEIYDALFAAEAQAVEVRGAYLVARSRDTNKAPR